MDWTTCMCYMYVFAVHTLYAYILGLLVHMQSRSQRGYCIVLHQQHKSIYLCIVVCTFILCLHCYHILFGFVTVLTKQHTVYVHISVFLLCVYISGVLRREVPPHRTDNLTPKVSSVERFHCIGQLILVSRYPQ